MFYYVLFLQGVNQSTEVSFEDQLHYDVKNLYFNKQIHCWCIGCVPQFNISLNSRNFIYCLKKHDSTCTYHRRFIGRLIACFESVTSETECHFTAKNILKPTKRCTCLKYKVSSLIFFHHFHYVFFLRKRIFGLGMKKKIWEKVFICLDMVGVLSWNPSSLEIVLLLILKTNTETCLGPENVDLILTVSVY